MAGVFKSGIIFVELVRALLISLLLVFLARSFLFTSAVLFDQFIQSFEVVEDVDATPSIQVSWLEEPEVERVKVAQRHRVLLVGVLLEVKRLELCDLA